MINLVSQKEKKDASSETQGCITQCLQRYVGFNFTHLVNDILFLASTISSLAFIPFVLGSDFDLFSASICSCVVFLVRKVAICIITPTFRNWYKSCSSVLRILVSSIISLTIAFPATYLVSAILDINFIMHSCVIGSITANVRDVIDNRSVMSLRTDAKKANGSIG